MRASADPDRCLDPQQLQVPTMHHCSRVCALQDTSDPPMGYRCVLWKQILDAGNVNLELPITCFKGDWTDSEPVIK